MNYDEIIAHLEAAVRGFDTDPADTDYQRGYLAALLDTYRAVTDDEVPVWMGLIDMKNNPRVV